MGFAENYFFRHSFLIPRIIEPLPKAGLLRYIVVIPAYLEDNLIATLNSIVKAENPNGDVLVLIIINFSESDTQENKQYNLKQYNDLSGWCSSHSGRNILFRAILADNLPKKHAGAGLARKIGMDIALYHFNGADNPDGMILSLDADALIEKNYFTAIGESMFSASKRAGGCIIRFAHTIEGDTFSGEIYDAIVSYELHLRYYKNILQHIGFPFARYTIGSCFGMRADVYNRHGGMNRKKGGEDFYFLNKLFPHERFVEINETCINLSPRPSLRVPFGTGPVVHQLIHSDCKEMLTYNPQAFYDLEKLFVSVDDLFTDNIRRVDSLFSEFSIVLKDFLIENSFSAKIREIRRNTAAIESFRKRFYLWFDGFRVVKYLNFAHREKYQKVPVQQAVLTLLEKMKRKFSNGNERYLLDYFRRLDMEE